MPSALIASRDALMQSVYRVMDTDSSNGKAPAYVAELAATTRTLAEMADAIASSETATEQARTFRYLGDVYSALRPGLGDDALRKAKAAYERADRIPGTQDEREHAVLDFNFGNALRLLDANDVELLRESKRRLSRARAYFAEHEPRQLGNVDAALRSVDGLLALAPLANTVQKNMADMEALKSSQLNAPEFAAKAKEIMARGGGVAGMLGQVAALVETLPPELRKDPRYAMAQEQLTQLSAQALQGSKPDPKDAETLELLRGMVEDLARQKTVSPERRATLGNLLDALGRGMPGDESVEKLMNKAQDLRELTRASLEISHYLSHGIPRPPEGSRAAALVELNWSLRRHLLVAMNQPEKGEQESKRALELQLRATKLDKRLYELGADDTSARACEREEFRPLAVSVRDFSARSRAMLVRPLWGGGAGDVEPNAIFYAGSARQVATLREACRRLNLDLLQEPTGDSYAVARWHELRSAALAVFDLRLTSDSDAAAVAYELGIAATLGKPVVVIVAPGAKLPFDVDVVPLVLDATESDAAALASALEEAFVSLTNDAPGEGSATIDQALAEFEPLSENPYVRQTLELLAECKARPDPSAARNMLGKLLDFARDGRTILVSPRWAPVYPRRGERRLFHVTPFGKAWSRVTDFVRQQCRGRVEYVRGDEVSDPDVIRSIWQEVGRASHVVVDLTTPNQNVALELGIAHTLGKQVLLISQVEPERMFASVRKLRATRYELDSLSESLAPDLDRFLAQTTT